VTVLTGLALRRMLAAPSAINVMRPAVATSA
jgi:hypothetical protein